MANLLQSGVASAERVFELLDAEEEPADPAGADAPARVAAARSAFEHVVVLLRPGPAAHRGPVAGGAARPDGRDRRADRRRQDHAGQPGHAVLRARRRPDHPRRRRHHRDAARRRCAAQIGMVLQDTWLFEGTIRDNIAYGRPGRDRGGDPRGRAGDVRRPVRALAARRLRHRGRRGGLEPVGGRAAAGHDRAGVPRRPGAADPRRGDVARSTPAPSCCCSRRWRRCAPTGRRS